MIDAKDALGRNESKTKRFMSPRLPLRQSEPFQATDPANPASAGSGEILFAIRSVPEMISEPSGQLEASDYVVRSALPAPESCNTPTRRLARLLREAVTALGTSNRRPEDPQIDVNGAVAEKLDFAAALRGYR